MIMQKHTSDSGSAAGPHRLGIIVNRQSGRNRSGLGALDALLASRADIAVRQPSGPAQVGSALAELAAEGVNLLGVCGGDGTVQSVLNVVLEPQTPFPSVPPLVVLPGGTTNMIAHDINHARRPVAVLESVLRHLDAGTLSSCRITRSVMRLTGGDAPGPAYGLFFGAAGVYEATMDNRNGIDTLGVRDGFGPGLRLAVILCKIATGRDPFQAVPMRLALDGRDLGDSPYVAVLASTMSKLALGMTPFWGEGPGAIRITLATAGSRSILRAIWLALRGRRHPLLNPQNGYDSVNANQIDLAFDGGCVLDGETFNVLKNRPIRLEQFDNLTFIRG